jgi:TRAP-type uncharacterized transport system substrate-binding protein
MRAHPGSLRRDGGHALLRALLLFLSIVLLGAGPAAARDRNSAAAANADGQSLADRLNANTVSIVSGTPGATYFRIASDIAFVLDDGDNLRVLPILGKGAEQNAYDILFLKGVDLGLVRTDTLDQLKRDPRIKSPEAQLVYIARLFNDEMHVIADTSITDIRQLAGKKVNFDVKGSGSNFTGRAVFELLNIPVEALNLDQPTALDMLKKGQIDAVVSVAAKPVRVIQELDGGGKLHLLDVPYPANVEDRYLPASVTSQDYPKLVQPGGTVNTVSVGTILGAYNWKEGTDRYKRLARFVDAFFGKFDEFQKPARHPKWNDVNLAATVPGWKRFKPAQDWLDNGSSAPTGELQNRFKQFMASKTEPASQSAKVTADERERLFKEFLQWNRSQQTKTAP